MQQVHKRLDHLVSMRGLAAWLVVLFHSLAILRSALPGLPTAVVNVIGHGYLAVDFFFVLSGFIIFINYHDKFFSNFFHNARFFYWNRISRIYPMHVFMLLAYLLLALGFMVASASKTLPPAYTAGAFWQSLLLLQVWGGSASTWNVPSWSISAEWFVYLLFPFTAFLFEKYIRKLAAHLLLAMCILVIVYAVYTLLDIESLGMAIAQMALVRAFFEFSLGVIAGSLFVRHHAFLMRMRVLAAALTMLICIAWYFFDLPNTAVVPLTFFLLVSFLSIDTSLITRALSNKLLVYLGEISYSTYMVHYFVYDVFKAGWVHEAQQVSLGALLVSFLVVLLLSMLTHRCIEIPAQQSLRAGFSKKFRSSAGFRI